MSMSNMPLRAGAERLHRPYNSRASSADLVLSGASNPHNQPVSVSTNGPLVTNYLLALPYPTQLFR